MPVSLCVLLVWCRVRVHHRLRRGRGLLGAVEDEPAANVALKIHETALRAQIREVLLIPLPEPPGTADPPGDGILELPHRRVHPLLRLIVREGKLRGQESGAAKRGAGLEHPGDLGDSLPRLGPAVDRRAGVHRTDAIARHRNPRDVRADKHQVIRLVDQSLLARERPRLSKHSVAEIQRHHAAVVLTLHEPPGEQATTARRVHHHLVAAVR
mmetsp:Transcript_10063/g.45838  ORF Transcript_10063/g.45838 Transcript_10063/m.45838 type:complete len:212 (-) Transcript_10063:597-1232(-)